MKHTALSLPGDASQPKANWKQRIVSELTDYWITFVYLGIFFAAFTWYRRLILAEYHISYLHYWSSVVQALILAKVVLVGGILNLGKKSEGIPVIFSALYKSAVFSVFVGFFALLESLVSGLLHGKGLVGGFQELLSEGTDELLARCLVTFCAFIPFFAFQELGRVLGRSKMRALLFRRGAAPEPAPDSK